MGMMKYIPLLFLLGCAYIRPTPLPPDATLDERCQAACENMKRLDVPGWEGSPNGTPCAEVCEKRETEGFPFHADCLAAADSIEAAEGCYQ
jgi:hypothetical protein